MVTLTFGSGGHSEWWRADNHPAVSFSDSDKLVVRRRNGVPRQLLEQAPGPARRVKEQHASALGAGALPGMRDATGHEGAGSRPADGELIADLERDLAAQDVGHLIAVVMEVHRGHGADRRRFLEHHHALLGIAVLQLEDGLPSGLHRPHRAFT